MRTNNEIKRDELWDYMVDTEIATENEISLVTALYGNTLENLELILYVRTGYRSLEQIKEEWGE